jgi:hypothetical protein
MSDVYPIQNGLKEGDASYWHCFSALVYNMAYGTEQDVASGLC